MLLEGTSCQLKMIFFGIYERQQVAAEAVFDQMAVECWREELCGHFISAREFEHSKLLKTARVAKCLCSDERSSKDISWRTHSMPTCAPHHHWRRSEGTHSPMKQPPCRLKVLRPSRLSRYLSAGTRRRHRPRRGPPGRRRQSSIQHPSVS